MSHEKLSEQNKLFASNYSSREPERLTAGIICKRFGYVNEYCRQLKCMMHKKALCVKSETLHVV